MVRHFRNVIVLAYVTFCQISKVLVNMLYFSIIDRTASQAGCGPRAVVWRPLLCMNKIVGLRMRNDCYVKSVSYKKIT